MRWQAPAGLSAVWPAPASRPRSGGNAIRRPLVAVSWPRSPLVCFAVGQGRIGALRRCPARFGLALLACARMLALVRSGLRIADAAVPGLAAVLWLDHVASARAGTVA